MEVTFRQLRFVNRVVESLLPCSPLRIKSISRLSEGITLHIPGLGAYWFSWGGAPDRYSGGSANIDTLLLRWVQVYMKNIQTLMLRVLRVRTGFVSRRARFWFFGVLLTHMHFMFVAEHLHTSRGFGELEYLSRSLRRTALSFPWALFQQETEMV